MHASPGQEEDYTLVLPWPPGVRIACLCLFHGLFRTIRNGVCQSLTSSRGLYHRETVVDGQVRATVSVRRVSVDCRAAGGV